MKGKKIVNQKTSLNGQLENCLNSQLENPKIVNLETPNQKNITKGSVKREKTLSFDIQKIIEFFKRAFSLKEGNVYLVHPKDEERIKNIIENYGNDWTKKTIERFMKDTDDYLSDKPRSIAVFAGQIPKYASINPQGQEIDYSGY